MPIRINTNIASLNAQRNLGNTNQMLSKTLERLSSGLRINRAADDAAGLAIAEKLNTQVRGFTQAIANAQDAGNLLATAESGLDQTTQILQRVRELSIQASSDTLVNSDRKKIQVEIDELTEELDRIATTTEFNTRALLDGSLQEGAAAEDSVVEIKSNSRVGQGSSKGDFISILTDPPPTNLAQDAAFTVTLLQGDGVTSLSNTSGGSVVSSFVPPDGNYVIEIRSSFNDAVSYYDNFAGGTSGFDIGIDNNLTDVNGNPVSLAITTNPNGQPYSDDDIGKTALIQVTAQRQAITEDKALTFQVGANKGQFLRAGVQDMRAQALRVEGLNIVGADDNESRLRAQNAIGVVDQALDYVSTVRSKLGAYQNRIEYRLNTLQVSRENLSASESRIRDADIAAETANLTRAQILVQAGTSVLSQANITPQSALNLL